jgi:hypothetical protein
MGNIQLEQNVYYCTANETQPLTQWHTVNQAILNFHPELFDDCNPDQEILSKEPLMITFEDLRPITQTNSAVVIHKQNKMEVKKLFNALSGHKKIFENTAQQNKANLKNLSYWGKISKFGIGSLITLILILVSIGVVLFCYFNKRIQSASNRISALPVFKLPGNLRESFRKVTGRANPRHEKSGTASATKDTTEIEMEELK